MTRFVEELCEPGGELHFPCRVAAVSLQTRVGLPKLPSSPVAPGKHIPPTVRIVIGSGIPCSNPGLIREGDETRLMPELEDFPGRKTKRGVRFQDRSRSRVVLEIAFQLFQTKTEESGPSVRTVDVGDRMSLLESRRTEWCRHSRRAVRANLRETAGILPDCRERCFEDRVHPCPSGEGERNGVKRRCSDFFS